jgi:Tol biopolymer transport system component
VLEPRTGRKRMITRGPTDLQPDWSPDGRRIVFAEDGENMSFASIWTVRDDGHGARRLTAGAHPVFSPSGQWIAFCRDDGLYRMRTDGTGIRRLLATKPLMPDRQTAVTATHAAWQPLPR